MDTGDVVIFTLSVLTISAITYVVVANKDTTVLSVKGDITKEQAINLIKNTKIKDRMEVNLTIVNDEVDK